MPRDWRLYARDILDYSDRLLAIASDVKSLEMLRQSTLHLMAAERCLEVLGEAAKKLPTDVRDKHNDVPWKNIIGMRDIIAHGYFAVSPSIIWDTVHKYLGVLKAACEAMLKNSGEKQV